MTLLMAFTPPDHFVVKTTDHWIVNHRVDSALPGYLMIGARAETSHLWDMPPAAHAELGPLLASVQKALTDLIQPENTHIGRYGHSDGYIFHFHVIPICAWVKRAFVADAHYQVLKSFRTPGVANSEFDGAELTLFVWRELCESRRPPAIEGPSVPEVIELLRNRLNP